MGVQYSHVCQLPDLRSAWSSGVPPMPFMTAPIDERGHGLELPGHELPGLVPAHAGHGAGIEGVHAQDPIELPLSEGGQARFLQKSRGFGQADASGGQVGIDAHPHRGPGSMK